jgi:hypothetical protein
MDDTLQGRVEGFTLATASSRVICISIKDPKGKKCLLQLVIPVVVSRIRNFKLKGVH